MCVHKNTPGMPLDEGLEQPTTTTTTCPKPWNLIERRFAFLGNYKNLRLFSFYKNKE
jgi:hypothetical protein